MDEIPRDIVQEAAKACKVRGILGNERTAEILLRNICEAILAERKRSERAIRELEYQIKMQEHKE